MYRAMTEQRCYLTNKLDALGMTKLDALRTIERSDPDGKPTEPTEEDHKRHRRWAIERFGYGVWVAYEQGGWEPAPDF